ncbi:lipid A biosynthesis acyltransferase [Flavobacteriaceae bacterium AH-315-O20]|nr:lipid A biosynthesis acyltransferase [Flavobacteriaceae bacterium AH-315-O20]
MQRISFLLIYPIIWLISILPLKVLYFFSDLIFIPLYYVIGYRKKVVRNNLKLSFPDKSDKELLLIEKKTFHHFIDIFMEMIKGFSISKKEMRKRIRLTNPEVLDEFKKQNKSIIIMAGHYANWEWVSHLNWVMDYDVFSAYKKIKNEYFDRKMKSSRTKFGAHFIATTDFKSLMEKHFKDKKKSMYGLLSDQSPKLGKVHYRSNFMGVNVPMQTGPETLAKKYDYPVIYLISNRIKRGYYEATIKILAEKPNDFKDYEITDLFSKTLEKQIRNNPEFYFWTHKRFKHRAK